MKITLILIILTSFSLLGQSKKIILNQYSQQVPDNKVWSLKSGQEVLCELSFRFTYNNSSLCAASLQSIPAILYGIAEGDRPNIKVTKLYLLSWDKEPYTNDYTYRIKLSSSSKLILLPGTKVFLTGCVQSLTVFESTVTQKELEELKLEKKKYDEGFEKTTNQTETKKTEEKKTESTNKYIPTVNYKHLAETNYNKGQYDTAIYYFSKELIEYPTDPYLYSWRARTKIQIKDYNGAIADLNMGIKQDSTMAELFWTRAEIYISMEEYKKAIKDCNKIISLGRRDLQINYLRGEAYYLSSNYKSALDDFNKQIKSDPFCGAYYYRGLTKNKLNDKIGACTDIKKAIQMGCEDKENILKSICEN